MDEKRKGEIALILLEYILLQKGITFSKNTLRNMGNVAKETGIPLEELKEFSKPIILGAIEKIFSAKSEDQGEAQAS